MRPLKIVFILLLTALSHLGATEPTINPYLAAMEVNQAAVNRHYFQTRDGFRLSWVKFESPNNGLPLLILPGKGESAFRYMELAHDLSKKGHGPIYLLEPRDQGFSQRSFPEANVIDIDSFQTYRDDLFEFMDGPLKSELSPELMQRLGILAHSMNGTVVNLALQMRPHLAQKIVLESPMIELNTHSTILNTFHEKPAKMLAHFACLFGCSNFHFSTMTSPYSTDPKNLDHARRAIGYLQEAQNNIASTDVTIRWVQEALQATELIQPQTDDSSADTLIFSGQFDNVVNNHAIYDYACASKNCSLIQLAGDHALHTSVSSVYKVFVNKTSEFLKKGTVAYFEPSSCAKILVKAKANRHVLGELPRQTLVP